jgi:hypothetical protein
MPGRRDDDDDAAAAPLLHHEAGDVLGAEEGARQVDADLAVPALERHVEHAQSTEDAGVVHEHVDAAVRFARPRHHRLDLRLVGDVADDAQRVTAAPHDRLRALHCIVRIDVHAHDARALVGQSLGDSATDVRTRPRHDHDFAGQAAHSRSFRIQGSRSSAGFAGAIRPWGRCEGAVEALSDPRRFIQVRSHSVASFERQASPAQSWSRRGPSRPSPPSADGPAPGGRGGAGSR